MKKLAFLLIVASLVFVGCKTTDIAPQDEKQNVIENETFDVNENAEGSENNENIESREQVQSETEIQTSDAQEGSIIDTDVSDNENSEFLPSSTDSAFDEESETLDDEFFDLEEFTSENIEDEPELEIFFDDETESSIEENSEIDSESTLDDVQDQFSEDVPSEPISGLTPSESVSEPMDETFDTESVLPNDEPAITSVQTQPSIAVADSSEKEPTLESATVALEATTLVVTELEKTEIDKVQESETEQSSVMESAIETEEEFPKSEKLTENALVDATPSRSVNMKMGQNLLVSYPGSSWVFLGETSDTPLFSFKEKMFLNGKTVFNLIPKGEGDSVLHFYKIDNLSNKYIDDFLAVHISGTDEKKTVVLAPDFQYQSYLLKDFSQNETENASSELADVEVSKTEIVEDEPDLVFSSEFETESNVTIEKNISKTELENLLNEAKSLFENAQFANALEKLNFFIENSDFSLDEAYFLKAKILEAKSEVRDIKNSLFCYEYVVENFPQSDFFQPAQERAKYIKRFYFNIR